MKTIKIVAKAQTGDKAVEPSIKYLNCLSKKPSFIFAEIVFVSVGLVLAFVCFVFANLYSSILVASVTIAVSNVVTVIKIASSVLFMKSGNIKKT